MASSPLSVGKTMGPYGVQSGVGQDDLGEGSRRRVMALDCLDVGPDPARHGQSPSPSKSTVDR